MKQQYFKMLLFLFLPSLISAQDLTIKNGATVSIKGNSFISVRSNFSNAGTLFIGATTSNYGQLKVNGTLNNSGTIVQSQYIDNTGYASISSPMVQDFTTTTGDNSKMLYYDGAAYQWRTSHEAGRGYYAKVGTGGFLTGAGVFSVIGTPNSGTVTQSLTNTLNTAANGSGSGWNLVGNPFTCGLDWTAIIKTNVNNSFYIWDPSTQLYKYYATGALTGTYLSSSSTLSAVIPPMQAFFVEATSTGGSLVSTMEAAGTVASAPAYLSKTNPDNFILGVVALADSSASDAMWILDNIAAREGFDEQHDAWKMYNGATQPNIYSVFKGEEMAINALDFVNTPLIPVGFDGPTKGAYAVSLEQIVNSVIYKVTLEDKHLDLFYDISSKDYTFKNIGWDSDEPRFALHVEQFNVMDVDENDSPKTGNSYYVYQDQQLIYVNQSEGGIFDSYILYGLDGRLISNGSVTNQLQSIQAPSSSGMYILVLQGAQSSERVKIIITK